MLFPLTYVIIKLLARVAPEKLVRTSLPRRNNAGTSGGA